MMGSFIETWVNSTAHLDLSRARDPFPHHLLGVEMICLSAPVSPNSLFPSTGLIPSTIPLVFPFQVQQ